MARNIQTLSIKEIQIHENRNQTKTKPQQWLPPWQEISEHLPPLQVHYVGAVKLKRLRTQNLVLPLRFRFFGTTNLCFAVLL